MIKFLPLAPWPGLRMRQLSCGGLQGAERAGIASTASVAGRRPQVFNAKCHAHYQSKHWPDSGIEIEEFPAEVARVSMWLMEHVMNVKFGKSLGGVFPFLATLRHHCMRQRPHHPVGKRGYCRRSCIISWGIRRLQVLEWWALIKNRIFSLML